MMKVLGISGSPIPNSNTDKAVMAVLQATGLDTEFIKLSDHEIAPCRACLGCLKTNRCVIKDDGVLLAEQAKEADALIVGGFTPYSTLDSRTKAFLERLYPLRHTHGFMRGKAGGAVITYAIPPGMKDMPPSGDMGVNAIKFYMMEEGMNFVGAVKILGNVPCVKCGNKECTISGLKMIFGPEATPDTVGINTFEDQVDALAAADRLGKEVALALQDG
jgi:multimeric flavodoxin WrbA